jgi:ferritin
MNWGCILYWIEQHPGLASWVQAFGSVAAILVAIYIASSQARIERKRQRSHGLNEYVKLSAFSAYIVEGMRQTIEKCEAIDAGFDDFDRHLSLLEESLEVLKSVEFSSIQSVLLATKWIQLRQILFDFIREGRKDIDLDKVICYRLEHMRRNMDRAIIIQSELFNTAPKE